MVVHVDWKKLLISILITFGAGFLSSLLANNMEGYGMLARPSFSPPGVVFPIVWSILYLLIGISFYLIWVALGMDKQRAFVMFYIQLFLNFIWSPIFFGIEQRFLALVILALLWGSILLMIYAFYKISKPAAYLLFPYFIWVSFAGVLNYAFWVLNR